MTGEDHQALVDMVIQSDDFRVSRDMDSNPFSSIEVVSASGIVCSADFHLDTHAIVELPPHQALLVYRVFYDNGLTTVRAIAVDRRGLPSSVLQEMRTSSRDAHKVC